MSCTAVVTASDSAVQIPGRVTCTCTVTNGSTAVSAIHIRPFVAATGGTAPTVAAVVGSPLQGIASVDNPLAIAATGTTTAFVFDVYFHAPVNAYGNAEPASLVYDVGCIITTLDGATRAVVAATVANVTVTPPSF